MSLLAGVVIMAHYQRESSSKSPLARMAVPI